MTETDKKHIICAFIQKQAPRLSQLLMAEESVLNFETVSTRAEELEQIFCLQSDSADIMAVIDTKSRNHSHNNDTRNISDLMERHEQNMAKMLNSFTNALTAFSNQNVQNQNYQNRGENFTRRNNNRSKPRSLFKGLDLTRLRGFCQYQIMKNGCNNSRCPFKHDNIPSDVLALKNEAN